MVKRYCIPDFMLKNNPQIVDLSERDRDGANLFEYHHTVLVDQASYEQLKAERDELRAKLNCPLTKNFVEAVEIEAAHQRERWCENDSNKNDSDWLWLIGYLAGKALHNPDGGPEKKLHRIITVAAAACNWHAQALQKSEGGAGSSF